jgi:hypothetical protein
VFTGVSSAPPSPSPRRHRAFVRIEPGDDPIGMAEADDAFLAVRDGGVHRIQTSIGLRSPVVRFRPERPGVCSERTILPERYAVVSTLEQA